LARGSDKPLNSFIRRKVGTYFNGLQFSSDFWIRALELTIGDKCHRVLQFCLQLEELLLAPRLARNDVHDSLIASGADGHQIYDARVLEWHTLNPSVPYNVEPTGVRRFYGARPRGAPG